MNRVKRCFLLGFMRFISFTTLQYLEHQRLPAGLGRAKPGPPAGEPTLGPKALKAFAMASLRSSSSPPALVVLSVLAPGVGGRGI